MKGKYLIGLLLAPLIAAGCTATPAPQVLGVHVTPPLTPITPSSSDTPSLTDAPTTPTMHIHASGPCIPMPPQVMLATDARSGGKQTDSGLSSITSVTSEPSNCPDYDTILLKLDELKDVMFHIGYSDRDVVSFDSNQKVTVGGKAKLILVVEAPATVAFKDFDLRTTPYDHAVLHEIKAVEETGGSETFVIGVDGKVPFGFKSGPGGKSGTDQIAIFLARQ